MELRRRSFLAGLGALLAGGWRAPLPVPSPVTIATQRSVPVSFTTFDNEFAREGAKIGTTIRIRLPNDFILRDTSNELGRQSL
jgi:hypothetical protein